MVVGTEGRKLAACSDDRREGATTAHLHGLVLGRQALKSLWCLEHSGRADAALTVAVVAHSEHTSVCHQPRRMTCPEGN